MGMGARPGAQTGLERIAIKEKEIRDISKSQWPGEKSRMRGMHTTQYSTYSNDGIFQQGARDFQHYRVVKDI